MSKRDPRPWKKGDKFSASHLNESVEGVMPLTRLHVDGHNFYQTRKGTIIAPPEGTDYNSWFFALLTNTGPSYHPADFTDERYWGKTAFPKSTTLESEQLQFEVVAPPTAPNGDTYTPYPCCITNLPEVSAHSHNLPVDETFPVVVYSFTNRDGTVIHNFMESGTSGTIKFLKITGFDGKNYLIGNPCADLSGTGVDVGKSYRIALTTPYMALNQPQFNLFQGGMIVGFLPIDLAAVGPGRINGQLVPFNQLPAKGKVGQTIIGTADSIGSPITTPVTLVLDYPVLHAVPI